MMISKWLTTALETAKPPSETVHGQYEGKIGEEMLSEGVPMIAYGEAALVSWPSKPWRPLRHHRKSWSCSRIAAGVSCRLWRDAIARPSRT